MGASPSARSRTSRLGLQRKAPQVSECGDTSTLTTCTVPPNAIGCVKLGAGLALLQVILRPGRACDTQRQSTNLQPDATT